MSGVMHATYVSWRIGRVTGAGMSIGRVLAEMIERLWELDHTASRTGREIAALRRRIGHGSGSTWFDKGCRPQRFIGRGLLVVSAAALVISYGLAPMGGLAPAGPGVAVAALVLSCFAVGVQGALAARLGRRLGIWRHSDPDTSERPEIPPRDVMVLLEGGALATIGTFIGAAHYFWAQDRVVVGNPEVALALGLVLAASALIAPLLVVSDLAYSPSPLEMRSHELSRVLRHVDTARLRLHPRVRGLLVTFDAALARAERIQAAAIWTATWLGYPVDHDGWNRPVERLAVTIDDVRQAYQQLLDAAAPPDRDDHDLAG